MKGIINIVFTVIAVVVCISAGIMRTMDQNTEGPILFTLRAGNEKVVESGLAEPTTWERAEITSVAEDNLSITVELLLKEGKLENTCVIEFSENGRYIDHREEPDLKMKFSDFKKGDIIQFKFQEILSTEPILVKAQEIRLLDRAILTPEESDAFKSEF